MEDKEVWERRNKRVSNSTTFVCTSCGTKFGVTRDGIRITNLDNPFVEHVGTDTVKVLYHHVTECPVCFNLASQWVEQIERLRASWDELCTVEESK